MFLMLQERAVEDKPAAHTANNMTKYFSADKTKEGAVSLNRTLLILTTPSATAGTRPR